MARRFPGSVWSLSDDAFSVAGHSSLFPGPSCASANASKQRYTHLFPLPTCLCACTGEDIAHSSTCLHEFHGVTPPPACLSLADMLDSQQPTCLMIPTAHLKPSSRCM